jgi:hypothetical protein
MRVPKQTHWARCSAAGKFYVIFLGLLSYPFTSNINFNNQPSSRTRN